MTDKMIFRPFRQAQRAGPKAYRRVFIQEMRIESEKSSKIVLYVIPQYFAKVLPPILSFPCAPARAYQDGR